MGLSTGEAKRQRRALLAEIAAEHLRKDREKLAQLRKQIRDVIGRRSVALATTRKQCKVGALAARERAKAQVELSQREIAKLIHEEARLAKTLRQRRYKPTAAELAAIPF